MKSVSMTPNSYAYKYRFICDNKNKQMLTFVYENQHWYTIINAAFCMLNLEFICFSITNKLSFTSD